MTPDLERALAAMTEALRKNCTNVRGDCYAVVDDGVCSQEGVWGAEVDGEFDLIPLVRAVILSLAESQSDEVIEAGAEELKAMLYGELMIENASEFSGEATNAFRAMLTRILEEG